MTQHTLFYGDSDFLIAEAVQSASQHGGKPVERLAKTVSAEQFLVAVQSTSLFASEGSMYVWEDPVLLSGAAEDAAIRLCERAFQVATQVGHQICIAVHGNLDNRRKIVKTFLAYTTTTACMQLKDWEQDKWEAWTAARLVRCGVGGDREALADALVATIGYDYGRLDQGIRNLQMYVGGQVPTVADVGRCNAKGTVGVFELFETLRGGVRAAFPMVVDLLDAGEDPFALLGVLVSQWRMYLIILDGVSRREPMAVIAKTVGKQPFYVEKIARDIRKAYTLPQLQQCLVGMHAVDVAMKSGKQRPGDALVLGMVAIR